MSEKGIDKGAKIFVAGHRGLVGSAIVRALRARGCQTILTRTHAELDLTDEAAVAEFFASERPDQVYLAAAKVGGIHANNIYPAGFIRDNLQIQNNVIHQAWRHGVSRLLFLGSSCIYPKHAPQPIKEDHLLTGKLEPTNEPYAIAKIAGIKMCESYNRQYGTDFRSAMPTNLYGPDDNFDLETSHVLPALIRKFHLAKLAVTGDLAGMQKDEGIHGRIPDEILQHFGCTRDESGDMAQRSEPSTPNPGSDGQLSVPLWGSGRPRREFLHVDDMAEACIHVMELERDTLAAHTDTMQSHINIGCGEDISIGELAELVKDVVGFDGEITYDTTKPDGTPRKQLDTSLINHLGWKPAIGLREGIQRVYRHYLRSATP